VADVNFLDVRQLHVDVLDADTQDVALAMDEEAFRGFYDRTSRALWGYLSRTSGDRQIADDLLQDCYYRLLKSTVAFESEAHRRNYLYRIATNLVRDTRRGTRPVFADAVSWSRSAAGSGVGITASGRTSAKSWTTCSRTSSAVNLSANSAA